MIDQSVMPASSVERSLDPADALFPFHFHRFWRALKRGTSPNGSAPELLSAKDASVTETAMAIGFGTKLCSSISA